MSLSSIQILAGGAEAVCTTMFFKKASPTLVECWSGNFLFLKKIKTLFFFLAGLIVILYEVVFQITCSGTTSTTIVKWLV